MEFVAFRRVLPGLCQPVVNQTPDSGDRAAQDRMLALSDCCEHRLGLFDDQGDRVVAPTPKACARWLNDS